jgi:cysteine desulfurase NifS/selenium donor protein
LHLLTLLNIKYPWIGEESLYNVVSPKKAQIMIYLDYNATTPLAPEVAEAMQPYIREHFGNPSSTHRLGVTAKLAVEKARQQVATLIDAFPDEIIFTSGGTESNNMALRGMAQVLRQKGNHIITSAIEHPAILEVCAWLEKQGFSVTYLPVDDFGRVDPEDVRKNLRPETILISIMHSNNETGSLQPIAEIAVIAREAGIIMHTDAAQSLGKVKVSVKDLGIDLLSIAGHKLYAPKGVGALYVRRGLQPDKIIFGAGQERGLRPGTENVIHIVALGEASRLAAERQQDDFLHLQMLRDRLQQGILEQITDARVNGHPTLRLPNTLSLSFYGIEAQTLISELPELAVSAGAACHSDRVDMSHVLTAMHVPVIWGMGTLRLSVGRYTTQNEADASIRKIVEAVRRLRGGTTYSKSADLGTIKLTQFTHGLGCACKLRPKMLESILQTLPVHTHPDLLVGTETSDDAMVYRISDDVALVSTVDFFTPIVDDPYLFGAIAAANSLSDIYAMGAKPLYALNIAAFPSGRLPTEVLEEILRGASDKAAEAGIPIAGGHTVEDTEPKFGLAVTGVVHPQRILRNQGAKPGDAILLTKPLGTGILSTALKRGMLDLVYYETLVQNLISLNKIAAEALVGFSIHACTDVTGFGLLGHLLEMCQPAGLGARLIFDNIPVLPGADSLALAGAIPGGSLDNLAWVEPSVRFADRLPIHQRVILADAQTNGGLLLAVPEDESHALLHALRERIGGQVNLIGHFTNTGLIEIQ